MVHYDLAPAEEWIEQVFPFLGLFIRRHERRVDEDAFTLNRVYDRGEAHVRGWRHLPFRSCERFGRRRELFGKSEIREAERGGPAADVGIYEELSALALGTDLVRCCGRGERLELDARVALGKEIARRLL